MMMEIRVTMVLALLESHLTDCSTFLMRLISSSDQRAVQAKNPRGLTSCRRWSKHHEKKL